MMNRKPFVGATGRPAPQLQGSPLQIDKRADVCRDEAPPRPYQALPPIFIVGVHRSGTTLLRYMLNSHSRIYIPPESDFIANFFLRRPSGELSERRIAQLLDTVFTRYRFVGEWQGDPPTAAAFIAAMPERTPAAFLDTLYGTYARQNDAVRWGDKTPIYASYVDLIHRILPQAQFIHIIRDARDAALSMLDKYEKEEFHVDVFFAARNWVRRIRKAQRDGARLPAHLYHEVRYEDLVQNPQHQLEVICDFLGERFEPAMLTHHRAARERVPADSHFFDNVRNPTTRQRIGRWRAGLAPRDQRLVQFVCGQLMDELDYEREDVGRMSPGELMRLAALAAKYATLQAGRRVLQEVGLMPPI
ncbi:MAG: sulfotransferase [Anaerolineae bacterium]|nr:sulfotransferase [Anaerolineae bacterium]